MPCEQAKQKGREVKNKKILASNVPKIFSVTLEVTLSGKCDTSATYVINMLPYVVVAHQQLQNKAGLPSAIIKKCLTKHYIYMKFNYLFI